MEFVLKGHRHKTFIRDDMFYCILIMEKEAQIKRIYKKLLSNERLNDFCFI